MAHRRPGGDDQADEEVPDDGTEYISYTPDIGDLIKGGDGGSKSGDFAEPIYRMPLPGEYPPPDPDKE